MHQQFPSSSCTWRRKLTNTKIVSYYLTNRHHFSRKKGGMGNIIESLASGFAKVIADILGKPLDFLSGKTCSSICGSTWDIICYIENFCLANLAKIVAIMFLLYLVLVFVYLIYKVGICSCVCHGMCTMAWSCISCSFSTCKNSCMLVCNKMRSVKRARQKQKRRLRNIEESFYSSSTENESTNTTRYRYTARSSDSERSLSRWSGNRRKVYLEKSLRPRNHRVMVGMSRRSVVVDRKEPRVNHRHERALHNIKVTHTSRFVHKGSGRRADYMERSGNNLSTQGCPSSVLCQDPRE